MSSIDTGRVEVLEELVRLLEVQNEQLQAFLAGLREIESRLVGRVIERGKTA